jgi:hypothetical protein
VARIVRDAGLFIGTDLNESEDALRFGELSDKWIDEFLRHRGELPVATADSMLDDLRSTLTLHCAPVRESPRRWGWKEPRSIYLLPFFHEHLPALRFLHVVRDGRDMALSQNQNQLRKHGDSAPIPSGLPVPLRSIALWSWVNLNAKAYGEERLGDRYLRVRFEDLCASPTDVARRILAFFELEAEEELAVDLVTPPGSIGRWRERELTLIRDLERVGGAALAAFGYQLSSA